MTNEVHTKINHVNTPQPVCPGCGYKTNSKDEYPIAREYAFRVSTEDCVMCGTIYTYQVSKRVEVLSYTIEEGQTRELTTLLWRTDKVQP